MSTETNPVSARIVSDPHGGWVDFELPAGWHYYVLRDDRGAPYPVLLAESPMHSAWKGVLDEAPTCDCCYV